MNKLEDITVILPVTKLSQKKRSEVYLEIKKILWDNYKWDTVEFQDSITYRVSVEWGLTVKSFVESIWSILVESWLIILENENYYRKWDENTFIITDGKDIK